MSLRGSMCREHLRSLASCAGILLLLEAMASAQGGPPLLTDDPWTPGDGQWEINFATTLERHAENRVVEAPLLDLNYGVGERLQLKYELPWIFVEGSDDSGDSGLGKSLAGVKWRFRNSGPALSIYPQLEFENPGSSSVERGIVDHGTNFLLPVEAAWTLGDYGLNLELGREFIDSESDEWIAGVALSRHVSDQLELLAEIHGGASQTWSDSEGVINLGTRVELAPGCVLLASIGSGVWADNSERADLLAYLGVQLQL